MYAIRWSWLCTLLLAQEAGIPSGAILAITQYLEMQPNLKTGMVVGLLPVTACVRRYCILCYTDVNHGFGSGFIKLQTSSDLGLGPYTAWNTPRSHGSYIIRSAKAEPVAITASTYLL